MSHPHRGTLQHRSSFLVRQGCLCCHVLSSTPKQSCKAHTWTCKCYQMFMSSDCTRCPIAVWSRHRSFGFLHRERCNLRPWAMCPKSVMFLFFLEDLYAVPAVLHHTLVKVLMPQVGVPTAFYHVHTVPVSIKPVLRLPNPKGMPMTKYLDLLDPDIFATVKQLVISCVTVLVSQCRGTPVWALVDVRMRQEWMSHQDVSLDPAPSPACPNPSVAPCLGTGLRTAWAPLFFNLPSSTHVVCRWYVVKPPGCSCQPMVAWCGPSCELKRSRSQVKSISDTLTMPSAG